MAVRLRFHSPPAGRTHQSSHKRTAGQSSSASRWREAARSAGGWSRPAIQCVRQHEAGRFGRGAGSQGACGGCVRRAAPQTLRPVSHTPRPVPCILRPASRTGLFHDTCSQACCGVASRRDPRVSPCLQCPGPSTAPRLPGIPVPAPVVERTRSTTADDTAPTAHRGAPPHATARISREAQGIKWLRGMMYPWNRPVVRSTRTPLARRPAVRITFGRRFPCPAVLS